MWTLILVAVIAILVLFTFKLMNMKTLDKKKPPDNPNFELPKKIEITLTVQHIDNYGSEQSAGEKS